MELKNTLSKFLLILIANFYAGSFILKAQPSQAVYLDKKDSTQNCYRIWVPRQPQNKLVILLPGYGGNLDDYTDEKIPQFLRTNGIYLAVISPTPLGTVFMDGDEISLKKLDTIVNSILRKFKIDRREVIMGGYSAGGMGAVKYAEFLKKGKGMFGIMPLAVFSVDAPFDLERWYYGNQVVINRKFASLDSMYQEKMLNGMLEAVLGGPPSAIRQEYINRSAFSASVPGGGNIQFLKDVAVRLYVEKDLDIWVKYYDIDFYSTNILDQGAIINQLKEYGNKEAELVVTTGKGIKIFQGHVLRNSHSWSIVDEAELTSWVQMQFNK
ncbi:MAG: hypothetical protein ABUT20_43020 [Bacteroidota bacterium]